MPITGAKRRLRMSALIDKQAGRCFWCETDLVEAALGHPDIGVDESRFMDRGTRDHLVASCMECYHLRSRIRSYATNQKIKDGTFDILVNRLVLADILRAGLIDRFADQALAFRKKRKLISGN